MFQKRTGRRWTWKSPNGVTKTKTDYILTNRPDIVADIAVINHVNIEGYEHRTGSRGGKEKFTNKRLPRTDLYPTNRIKEDRIPTQIQDTTRTRQHRHQSKTIKDIIQQSMSRVNKAINKPLNSRILSSTGVLMMNRQ